MIVAILIMVTFLVAIQVLSLIGLTTNRQIRNELAKKIAQELREAEIRRPRGSSFS